MGGSLKSDVELRFSYDDLRGKTLISKRKAGGLCHIGKPYLQGDVLGLQLVNPTAGLFSGDHLGLLVDVPARAKVALTSPSATRYHTMPEGRAEMTQSFSVGDEAWLDWWPEMVIPQHDSDTVLSTTIHLSGGAEMAFLDTLAPGRVSHGEVMAFRRLETQLNIFLDDALLVRERCVLDPAAGRWPLEVPHWDLCYYGALWIAGPQAAACVQIASGLWTGATLVSESLAVIRVLAPSSRDLKRQISELRKNLSEELPLLATDFRKL